MLLAVLGWLWAWRIDVEGCSGGGGVMDVRIRIVEMRGNIKEENVRGKGVGRGTMTDLPRASFEALLLMETLLKL